MGLPNPRCDRMANLPRDSLPKAKVGPFRAFRATARSEPAIGLGATVGLVLMIRNGTSTSSAEGPVVQTRNSGHWTDCPRRCIGQPSRSRIACKICCRSRVPRDSHPSSNSVSSEAKSTSLPPLTHPPSEIWPFSPCFEHSFESLIAHSFPPSGDVSEGAVAFASACAMMPVSGIASRWSSPGARFS
jgi:hypothetical protein